jgi:hypothetical protein
LCASEKEWEIVKIISRYTYMWINSFV